MFDSDAVDSGSEDQVDFHDALEGLSGGRSESPKTVMEHEKRLRREIANSNERRRMQSINAGFASLKSLLPHHDGEKLSKAAILQHTAEYIYQLEQEKTRLLSQNCQLKRLLNQHHQSDVEASPSGGDSPNEDRSINACSPVVTTIVPDQQAAAPEPNSSSTAPVVEVSSKFHQSEVRTDFLRNELLKGSSCRSPRSSEGGREHKRIKLEEAPPPRVIDARNFEVSNEQPKVTKQVISTHKPAMTEVNAFIKKVKVEAASPSLSSPSAYIVKDEQELDLTLAAQNASAPKYSKMILKTHNGQQYITPVTGSRVALSNNTISYGTNLTPSFNLATTNSTTGSPGTILTMVPNSKVSCSGFESMNPVLELHSLNDVGGQNIQQKVSGSRHNNSAIDLYIVNSSPSSTQKSLNTICEAIRHLEGDHMFPPQDDQQHHHLIEGEHMFGEEPQHHIIEEEVVTEDTLTIDGSQRILSVQEHHIPDHRGQGSVVQYQYETVESSGIVVQDQDSSDNTLDLRIPIIEEPQEAPLELTTTHRGAGHISFEEHHHYQESRLMSGSSSRGINHHPKVSIHKEESIRPGVIVVQQP